MIKSICKFLGIATEENTISFLDSLDLLKQNKINALKIDTLATKLVDLDDRLLSAEKLITGLEDWRGADEPRIGKSRAALEDILNKISKDQPLLSVGDPLTYDSTNGHAKKGKTCESAQGFAAVSGAVAGINVSSSIKKLPIMRVGDSASSENLKQARDSINNSNGEVPLTLEDRGPICGIIGEAWIEGDTLFVSADLLDKLALRKKQDEGKTMTSISSTWYNSPGIKFLNPRSVDITFSES